MYLNLFRIVFIQFTSHLYCLTNFDPYLFTSFKSHFHCVRNIFELNVQRFSRRQTSKMLKFISIVNVVDYFIGWNAIHLLMRRRRRCRCVSMSLIGDGSIISVQYWYGGAGVNGSLLFFTGRNRCAQRNLRPGLMLEQFHIQYLIMHSTRTAKSHGALFNI